MNYQKYLQSDLWWRKRSRVLHRRKYKCAQCGCANELDVHYLSYERLGNERDEDLIVLCRRCHKDLHYFKNCTVEAPLPVTEEEYKFKVLEHSPKAVQDKYRS